MLNPDLVDQAVILTFEEMAFLDVAPGPAPDRPSLTDDGPVLYLAYSQPKAGAVTLYLSKEVKFQVAEAIYGDEWRNLTAAQLDDSLLELANVLVGRLLTLKFGQGSGYKMGLPTVLFDPPEEVPGAVRTDYPYHLDEAGLVLSWSEAE